MQKRMAVNSNNLSGEYSILSVKGGNYAVFFLYYKSNYSEPIKKVERVNEIKKPYVSCNGYRKVCCVL